MHELRNGLFSSDGYMYMYCVLTVCFKNSPEMYKIINVTDKMNQINLVCTNYRWLHCRCKSNTSQAFKNNCYCPAKTILVKKGNRTPLCFLPLTIIAKKGNHTPLCFLPLLDKLNAIKSHSLLSNTWILHWSVQHLQCLLNNLLKGFGP